MTERQDHDPTGSGGVQTAQDALAPGLYFVSTPIGAARDITLRALDILATADVLAVEDTRTARKLLELHGIARRARSIVAYHDHNASLVRPKLMADLAAGRSVAYASDAGTPLLADPGYRLARAAIAAGHPVHASPGPSALLSALAVAGLPTDRFLFAGFPPTKAGKRRAWLADQAACRATVVFYESAKRVHDLLGALCDTFGAETEGAICRELTKRHEEVLRGSLTALRAQIDGRALKGEIVVVVAPPEPTAPNPDDVEAALRRALASGSTRDAAETVAREYGLARRDVYRLALTLTNPSEGV